MDELLTIEALLEGRLNVVLHPAAARRNAVTLLPNLVAVRLARRVDDAMRAHWTERWITEIWPTVRKERGERWDLGWAELTAGLALVVELLGGELPRQLHAELQGTPADDVWRLARRPFQRFVLLVDSSVYVRRVFATVRQRPSDVPLEHSPDWTVDGPAFRDRSHTLMLALLADDVLPADAGPVAATGELLQDGQCIGPVGRLVEKAGAWRRLHPEGLFISAPPDDRDVRTWSALARPSTRSTDREDPCWIVGATLREISAKLRSTAASIASWDGTPLTGDAVLNPRLFNPGPELPESPSGDPLLDAAWAAFREARVRGKRRGVVIQGLPGSGKSVLSMTLARRFTRGALSALGYGVRRSARDLAADIERSPSGTWPAVLAVREPQQAELFEALDKTQRLVPIVDGLDEVQPEHFQAIADWLRAGHGWWIATSRPLRGVGAALPPAWELRLEDLMRHEARKLLVALGRGDLADAALPDGGQASTPATVQELTRTPLHTALLAKVVLPGEDLRLLNPHTLYERAFEALLDHACRSRRLTTADAGLVRQLLSSVVGELAITWLQSQDGLLDREAIYSAFVGTEMGPLDQVRALESLAFGHLLVPAGAAWEFGHRTIAEWAAATALRRRVERGLRRSPDEPAGRHSRRRRAEVELDAIGAFLEDDVLPHQGRWATLLRFYAPFVQEPVSLLDRLLGPARATAWRMPDRPRPRDDDEAMHERWVLRTASSTEVLASWGFAYDILRLCKWSRPTEARAAWALSVRRWLLMEFEETRWGERDRYEALRDFAAAVSEHLPESLDDLVALAARTEAQRTRLRTDPLLLLSAIPAARASVLHGLLERGERSQQLAVIEWYSAQGIEPPTSVLDRLARDIPDELDQALQARDAQRDGEAAWSRRAIDRDAGDVLSRLEAAVWKACIENAHEPPWPVIRRRFATWPAHLDAFLRQWFGTAPAPESGPTAQDDAYRRRREALASLLDQAATTHREIVGIVAALDDRSERTRVLGRVKYFFNDGEDRALLRVIERITSTQGWTEDQGWEPRQIDGEPVAAAIRVKVDCLHQLRTRAALLIGSLDSNALNDVAGELWAMLRPDNPGRCELLFGLEGQKDVPRQVPAAAIIRHHGGAGWQIEGTRWTADHLAELRRISGTGAGLSRYEAVCALARATGGDELAELLHHLPSDDEEFTSLAYEFVASRRIRGDEGTVPDVPDTSRLPLGDRAARDVPGWRAELLARLAGNDTEDLTMLTDLAVRHGVREVLPFLAQHLTGDEWRDRRLVEAIALLATDRDEDVARVALRHALRVGWPDGRSPWSPLPRDDDRDTTNAGVVLARFLRIEDVDVLSEGSVSALHHPSLAWAIRGLGPSAIRRLVALHEVAARRAIHLETALGAVTDPASLFSPPPDPELERARAQRDSLAETIIASLDPTNAAPAELVDLLSRIAGEDVHHVYGVPGPLGSDFDEPGDMEWHADQINEGLVEVAMRALEESLLHRPDDWPALRRLFHHPSESVRKRAFELCADRAASHEVAALALAALEGHVQENRTRWTGQTIGLLLAGHQSGAGSVSIKSPDIARSLVAAVRDRLTSAHKNEIQGLAAHPLPAFRRLAAQWAGELGASDWVRFVVPMLEDVDAGVVGAALGALSVLAPDQLDTCLTDLRDVKWTSAHDNVLLLRLLPSRESLVPLGVSTLLQRNRDEQVKLADHIEEATLVRLLIRATDRAEANGDRAATRTDVSCFGGSPSLVERVLSAWPQLLGPATTEVFQMWTGHPVQTIRVVGRRQLAVRGLLDADLLESLLVGPLPADRVSGAECVVRMSMEPLREAAMRVLRGALIESPSEADFQALALTPPKDSGFGIWKLRSEQLGDESALRRRVLWALRGATTKFAEALALVANRLPYDPDESCLEPEGEEIVRDVVALIRGWGEEGAITVLDLIDRGEIEDDYSFLTELRQAAERHGRVLAAVRDGAARGGAASLALLTELNKSEFDRDLEGLGRLLRDEIFPPGWPDSSNWQ